MAEPVGDVKPADQARKSLRKLTAEVVCWLVALLVIAMKKASVNDVNKPTKAVWKPVSTALVTSGSQLATLRIVPPLSIATTRFIVKNLDFRFIDFSLVRGRAAGGRLLLLSRLARLKREALDCPRVGES